MRKIITTMQTQSKPTEREGRPVAPSPLSDSELENLPGPIRAHIEQLRTSHEWLKEREAKLDRECGVADAKLCIAVVYLTSGYFRKLTRRLQKQHSEVVWESLLY